MKFKNIYKRSEENVESALLNLWTLGDHPMRDAVKEMFQREPLIAEPVFQSTYGWMPTDNDEWRSCFLPDVIKKIGIGEKYPPYKHQADSWMTLLDNTEKKSIVVTSGTGSGKTECFMYPVINDIVKNGKHNAVQAIFLYPLNALMADQCDRLGELCDKVGASFAVYNGNTKENVLRNTPRKEGEHESQLRSRTEIRNNPPQILLSNPSMLEYMLVRGSDQTIMNQSKGELRWIVIDEAHSYSGSSAVELKLQIRRILEAFGTDISQVQFACTSATIGGVDGVESLKEFISSLTGQDKSKIEVIGGERQIPELTVQELEKLFAQEDMSLSPSGVMRVRELINTRAGMSLRDMWHTIHGTMEGYSVISALEELDSLCEMKDGRGLPILSLRIHFHMRTISGLYSCVNPSCNHHSTTSVYRNLTSFTGSTCPHCNSTMLELTQCKDCGQFMISGEVNSQNNVVRQHTEHKESNVGLRITDASGEELTSESRASESWTGFSISPSVEGYEMPIENGHVTSYDFVKDTFGLHLNQVSDGKFIKLEGEQRALKCTNCGMSEGSFLHFRVPVDTLNKIVGRVLLEETAGEQEDWGKYIAFTDSRQGTAISAKTFNIESERIIGVARIIKYLIQQRVDFQKSEKYVKAKKIYESLIALPEANRIGPIPQMIEDAWNDMNNDITPVPIKSLSDVIFDPRMFDHLKSEDDHIEAYKAAVTRSILGHKTIRKPSPESMGTWEIVYTNMSSIHLPERLAKMRKADGTEFTDKDWQDFLTIALDYEIRISNSIQPLIDKERQYVREGNLSMPMAPVTKDIDRSRSNIWVKVSTNGNQEVMSRQNRLVLLLCAALGYYTKEELSNHIADINALLECAWNDLTKYFLTEVQNTGAGYTDSHYYGTEHVGSYYLDVSKDSTICSVQFLKKAWQCPVTRRLLNTAFCGYSPSISGKISTQNIAKYKITQDAVDMPIPSSVNRADITDWLKNDDKIKNLKTHGLWSDLNDNFYQTFSSYIAAEHSAQQSDIKLEEYTQKFKNRQLNVLNCSTTMEMGVDIGDIEVVLMDTVPPAAANYLQRAGRAGRARQSKAVAFTLCNATPIGMKAFQNPMWALLDTNDMKMVLASPVILQRHINSFLMHEYINKNIAQFTTVTNLVDFFGSDENGDNICNDFIEKLNGYSIDPTIEDIFHLVFGKDVDFSVRKTVSHITEIKKDYWTAMTHLTTKRDEAEKKMLANPSDKVSENLYHAVKAQVLRVRRENLLTYLSEKQFIPNANMPTGIIEFDYSDETTARKKREIIKKRQKLKDEIEAEKAGNNDKTRIDELKDTRRKLAEELDKLIGSTQVSRDVRTALNEYAPGQTIVINERNYVSEGIALWDNMDGQPRRRYLYHCEECGHTKYTSYILEGDACTCEACKKDKYVSVIPRLAKMNHPYTTAYEPIKFRTTANARTTRVETTERRYYDIRVELTDLSWANGVKMNNIELTGQQEGEIIYYNLGLGEGFAVCSICGRSTIDFGNDDKTPIPAEHNDLDGQPCTGGIVHRHIAFTGRQQTCYTAIRFYNDGVRSNDTSLAISMGVVLKRALVKYLGIDINEVEFGIKNEKDAVVLFIYDVNKGGCGYSMHLADPVECKKVLDIALEMVQGYTCHCENDVTGKGCCSHCLIDRTTFKYKDYLSKSDVLAWLYRQKGNSVDVPEEISNVSPDAISRPESMNTLLTKAVSDNNVTEIGIGVSAKAGLEPEDFTSISTSIGLALSNAVHEGKTVKIYVEYDKDIDDFDTLLALANMKTMLSNFEVVPVRSLGDLPTVMLVKSDNKFIHYFTDQDSSTLSMSSDWIETTNRIFSDDVVPSFETISLPTMSSLKETMRSQGRVILEGDLPDEDYMTGSLFTRGILRNIVREDKDLQLMLDILKDQNATVDFSDSYVNSALAAILLPSIIKEVSTSFNCKIDNITLQLDSYKRNGIGSNYGKYEYITKNFENKQACDEFLKDRFEDFLGMDYLEYPNEKHHRWLKFTTPKGVVEIRPDHGLDGGWYTSVKYNQIEDNPNYPFESIKICKSQHGKADIVYYILLTKK